MSDDEVVELCGECGRPATGFGVVNGVRYCHGDDDPTPTCYSRNTWRRPTQMKQYTVPISIDPRVVISTDSIDKILKSMWERKDFHDWIFAPNPFWREVTHPFPRFELFPGGQWLDSAPLRFKRFRRDWTDRVSTCYSVLRGEDIHADCDYY